MRTSARRNLIIFSGWDLLLDVPHRHEGKLRLQLLKHLLPEVNNISDFNEGALQWLWVVGCEQSFIIKTDVPVPVSD